MLILGSMPGAASLRAGRYYAHPHNAFWPILGALLGFDPAAPYARRVAALKKARIAVWDVLHSCVRDGSLDSSIEAEIAHDFAAFFRAHPGVTHVFFNGGKAESSWRRHVAGKLATPARRHLALARLPSTSPAHAALPRSRKLAAWRAILRVGESS